MPSSEDLDVARRRLLYRCWHRGTREMDLLLGRFAEAHIAGMADDDLAELEELLDVEEKDLFGWLTDQKQAPERFEDGVLGSIRRFHRDNPVSEA